MVDCFYSSVSLELSALDLGLDYQLHSALPQSSYSSQWDY